MIKCTNCNYCVNVEEKDKDKYPICCLYCMDIDRVAIFNLCSFMEKEDDNNQNEYD